MRCTLYGFEQTGMVYPVRNATDHGTGEMLKMVLPKKGRYQQCFNLSIFSQRIATEF